MGDGLIHAHGGGQGVAAHIGDAGELEQPLDGAVLPVFAVEGREDHVQGDHLGAGVAQSHQAVDRGVGGQKGRGDRPTLPGAGGKVLHRAGVQQPFPRFGDAHHGDVVLLRVQVLKDGGGGHEGHFVLGGLAAEDYGQPQFFPAGVHKRSHPNSML